MILSIHKRKIEKLESRITILEVKLKQQQEKNLIFQSRTVDCLNNDSRKIMELERFIQAQNQTILKLLDKQ